MPLASGTRLGPYEIVSPLGAGGMGEVYVARDARLARTVAVKILPSGFAGDPGRRTRGSIGLAGGCQVLRRPPNTTLSA